MNSTGYKLANKYSCIFRIFMMLVLFTSDYLVYAHESDGYHEEDNFIKALTSGKVDFLAHYRFEYVDDDAKPAGMPLKDAEASTIRSVLGYTTGEFFNFGARLAVQDVRTVGPDDFNDGTGRPNAKTRFAGVADPSETDFLEGYISYTGIPDTTAKVGRQIITYRKAPFHRYMGTVLWRQNWQNHDAFTFQNKTLPDTTIKYGYSWNVNRIFTEKAVDPKDNWDSNSHFVNIKYDGFKYAKLEGYAYLLDFENDPANSVETYGGRMNGGYPLTEKFKAIYTAEYATQDDYGDNPANVDEDYFLGEIGGSFKPGNFIDSVTLKFSYELLEGNGITSFRTPLATGHAFQGWNDRFLTTPADGVEDYYFTLVAKVWGATFIASYHDINSDNLDYSYGDELDLLLAKTFKKHYTLGIKYGAYDADQNVTNIANNGGSDSFLANDVNKFWAWAQIKF